MECTPTRSNWMDDMTDIGYEDFVSAGDSALDESAPLYHYLSTDRFISLLGLKKIWLKQITKWPDFREGAYHKYKQSTNQNHPFANTHLNEFYGTCWSLQVEDRRLYSDEKEFTLANDELARDGMDAMWRAYCPTGGVRIKTTQKKLKDLLLATLPPGGQLVGGRAYYAPLGGNLDKTIESTFFAGLFHKRIPFRSETEYRFIFTHEPNTENRGTFVEAGIGSDFGFIEEVLISPAGADSKETHNHSHALIDITQRHTGLSDMDCRISRLYGVI